MAGKGGKAKTSALSAKTNAKRNTKSGRDQMSASAFGVPQKKKYRIDDPAHARNALARVAQHGSAAEQNQVKARVAKKYPGINVTGIRTSGKK